MSLFEITSFMNLNRFSLLAKIALFSEMLWIDSRIEAIFALAFGYLYLIMLCSSIIIQWTSRMNLRSVGKLAAARRRRVRNFLLGCLFVFGFLACWCIITILILMAQETVHYIILNSLTFCHNNVKYIILIIIVIR